MNENKRNLLKSLPSVDYLLKLMTKTPQSPSVKKATQTVLTELRQQILAGTLQTLPEETSLVEKIKKTLVAQESYHLTPVVNASGTIVHTNLGRSILSKEIKEQLIQTSFGYSNLELDLTSGKRGSRYQHIEAVIQELTGAESVLVVNNNAAAVMLVLNSLIKDKQVLVSRGELVEIGGSFRIPDVINLSGGTICEVGTTNKTHLSDYSQALTEETGAIMKVHTSNYRIVGFTQTPDLRDLADLAQKNSLPLINDLGSGLLFDLQACGLPYEPTIQEALEQGCDVVTFSGDKLLGGPQAGIIVGKAKYIEPMKKNQLLRALRVDKMTLAALEATLNLYRDQTKAFATIPTLNMISKTKETCFAQANDLKSVLSQINIPVQLSVVETQSNIGGGAYPGDTLPSYAVALIPKQESVAQLERRMRLSASPVIGRISKEQLLLDVRTLQTADYDIIAQNLQNIYKKDTSC